MENNGQSRGSFPVVGDSPNSDYNIVKHEFNVPIVLRSELLHFTEEYIHPSIFMNDGKVFILITNAALDIYHVERYGTAIFKTNRNHVTNLPPYETQNANILSFKMVPAYIIANRGLMNMTTSLPFISMRINPDQPPVKYYVVSNAMANAYKLQTSATFKIPLDNKHGSNPLVFDDTERREHFAIPPNPSDVDVYHQKSK